MKRLITLLLVLLPFLSFGSHYAGGDIQYKYVGDSTGINNHYKVILRLYRDVGGIGMPLTTNVTVSSSCFTNQNVPMILQAGSGSLAPTLFDCVTVGTPGTRTFEIYTYKGFVVLPGVCPTFKFWWEDCCRPEISPISLDPTVYLVMMDFSSMRI